MERVGTGTNTDFFSSTSHDDLHSGSPLSEPLGASTGDTNLSGRSTSNERIVGMLESVGIPRSTSENVLRAVSSPRVKETGRKVTTYAKRHPVQILGAVSAVAAIGTGLAMMKSRRNRPAF